MASDRCPFNEWQLEGASDLGWPLDFMLRYSVVPCSITNEKKMAHQLDQCLAANNTVELYLVVLDFIREELETSDQTKGTMKKVSIIWYNCVSPSLRYNGVLGIACDTLSLAVSFEVLQILARIFYFWCVFSPLQFQCIALLEPLLTIAVNPLDSCITMLFILSKGWPTKLYAPLVFLILITSND